MRLLLAATLALASASTLGQDAPAAEETKAATGNKRASTAVNFVAVLVTTCADKTAKDAKDACNALQSIQSLAECGLNPPNSNDCSWQVNAEKGKGFEGFMLALVVGNIASLASDCAEETDAAARGGEDAAARGGEQAKRRFAWLRPRQAIGRNRSKDREREKDACGILQSILPIAECGLNAPNPSACDQPIAEAKAQWETPPAEAEAE